MFLVNDTLVYEVENIIGWFYLDQYRLMFIQQTTDDIAWLGEIKHIVVNVCSRARTSHCN